MLSSSDFMNWSTWSEHEPLWTSALLPLGGDTAGAWTLSGQRSLGGSAFSRAWMSPSRTWGADSELPPYTDISLLEPLHGSKNWAGCIRAWAHPGCLHLRIPRQAPPSLLGAVLRIPGCRAPAREPRLHHGSGHSGAGSRAEAGGRSLGAEVPGPSVGVPGRLPCVRGGWRRDSAPTAGSKPTRGRGGWRGAAGSGSGGSAGTARARAGEAPLAPQPSRVGKGPRWGADAGCVSQRPYQRPVLPARGVGWQLLPRALVWWRPRSPGWVPLRAVGNPEWLRWWESSQPQSLTQGKSRGWKSPNCHLKKW